MINNKVIVVGGDHYNTLWVIRSLGIAGINSFVIINSLSRKSFVAKSKYVKKCWFAKNESQFLQILETNFSLESNRPIIICSSDICADIVDRNYEILSRKFILPNINNQAGEVSRWMNKDIMTEAAREAGFNVPRTWHIDFSKDDCEEIPKGIVYPCIVKPQKSSEGSKYDFAICTTASQLKCFLEKLSDKKENIVIQEYLKPDFEISFLGVNLLNANLNIIPGLLYKLGTCTSIHNMGMPTYACVSPDLDPYIDKDVVSHFFDKVRYKGLYSIEFFVSGEKAYFLEINLRTDGDMFVYTAAGVNMPLLWVMDSIGKDISCLQKSVKKVVYGMTEISYIKYLHWKNIGHFIIDLWRSKCFSIFSIYDIKPFIYKLFFWLR